MKLFLKNLLFTLVVPGTGGVYVPLLLAQNRAAASGLPFILALVLFATGSAVYVWCVWDFASFGRGTPLPIDAPKKLVVRGLYRYVRNPIYLGMFAVLLGWVVMFGGTGLVLYLFGAPIGVHLFVVLYEEPHLAGEFGDAYADYTRSVARWLPALRRKSGA